MAAPAPGPIRRAGLSAYRRLPKRTKARLTHLSTPSFSLGAVAVIEWQGRILGLEQTHRRGFSLPGGLAEKHESPDRTVTREVLEETGLRIDPGEPQLTVVETTVRHVDFVFRVEAPGELELTVGSEAFGYRWLSLAEWPEMDGATYRILQAYSSRPQHPRSGRIL
jgi:8-oxo-dGTP diphosphatase